MSLWKAQLSTDKYGNKVFSVIAPALGEVRFGPLAILDHPNPLVYKALYFPGLLCHTWGAHSDTAAMEYIYLRKRKDDVLALDAKCFKRQYGVMPNHKMSIDRIQPYSGLELPAAWMDSTAPVYQRFIEVMGYLFQLTGQQQYVWMAQLIYSHKENLPRDIKKRLYTALRNAGLKHSSSFEKDLEVLRQNLSTQRNWAWRIRMLLAMDASPNLSAQNADAMRSIHNRLVYRHQSLTIRQERYVKGLEIQYLRARMAFRDDFLEYF